MPDEARVVRDARAVAALWSQFIGRGRLGPLALGLGRVWLERPCLWKTLSQRLGLVVIVSAEIHRRRRLHMGGADDELRGIGLGRQQRLDRLVLSAGGSRDPRPSCRRGRPACRGRRPGSRAPQHTRRAGDPGAPRANHTRDARSRDQDQPGDEQEHREDVGAHGRDQVRGDPQLTLSEHATAPLEQRRAPELRRGNLTRPHAQSPRSQRERDRARQADRARPQRPSGRPHLTHQH